MWSITQEYQSLTGCPATLNKFKAQEIQRSPSFSVLTGFVPKQMLNLMAWDPALIKCCSRLLWLHSCICQHTSLLLKQKSQNPYRALRSTASLLTAPARAQIWSCRKSSDIYRHKSKRWFGGCWGGGNSRGRNSKAWCYSMLTPSSFLLCFVFFSRFAVCSPH